MKALLSCFLGVSFPLILFGCGGGGGGGGAGGGPMSLVSWLALTPPETVQADGLSQHAEYTVGADPVYVEYDANANSSAIVTFDAGSNITEIEIETPYQVLTWSTDNDVIESESKWGYAIDGDQSNIAIVSNPLHEESNPAHLDVGWQYQTFGTWMTGRQPGPDGFTGSGTLGGVSVGVPTPGSAVPDSDGVTFRGNTAGLYIDATGDDYFAWSTVDFVVNFAEAPYQLVMSTHGTPQITPVAELLDGVPSLGGDAADLALSGTLTYNPDTNLFSGTILTSGLGLSGSSTGQFYGPGAEELGGVFSLDTADPESSLHYSGAYGAADIAQPPAP